MTCAFLLSCLPGGAVLYSGSKPSWGSPELCAPAFAGIAPRHRCAAGCAGCHVSERIKSAAAAHAAAAPLQRMEREEGRLGTVPSVWVRERCMGCAAASGVGPLRCRAALCARFPLTIPHGAEKSNLFVCCRTLLCAFTAVECIFHALLTVESLTFPRILPIIKVWKKNRTTWRPSSARTSCA